MDRKTFWVVITASILGLALVAGGIWWLRSRAQVGLRDTVVPTASNRTGESASVSATTSQDQQRKLEEQEAMVKALPPDQDGDSIPDSREAEFKTDPQKSDTDGDGFTDADEINVMKTDPTKPDPRTVSGRPIIEPTPTTSAPDVTAVAVPVAPADTDGDGLSDEEEARRGTNGQIRDTDGDTLTDGEEIGSYKTDPRVKDSDNDGYTDADEIKNGYNPLGAGRCPTPGCIL
jgi:hypothetical protein